MTALSDELEVRLWAHLIGRQMACPVTGQLLDVRTAVCVEAADGVTTLGIFSPQGWEQTARQLMADKAPDARIIVHGQLQEH